jgi:hypothetical protein
MVVVLALNVPELAPAAICTDAGMVNTVPVLVRFTLAPPAGAALLNVIVHVDVAFAPNDAGLHDTVETVAGVTKLTIVFDELLL